MPAEPGFQARLYCEIATSKPSVAMSIRGFSPALVASSLPRSRRLEAFEPRMVSDDQSCILPLWGILSDSGLCPTMGPS